MTGAQPVRVLIVDDHPVVVQGLVAALTHAPEVTVVGTASCVREAWQLIQERTPQVVLLDLRLPDEHGLVLVRRCSSLPAPPAFVVFTAFGSPSEVAEAQRAGALGFLRKGTELQHIRLAIAKASRREVYWEKMDVPMQGETLSSREREILECLALGLSIEATARKLGLAPSTVKSHVHHILSKLGARNSRQAVYKALQQGLLSLPLISRGNG